MSNRQGGREGGRQGGRGEARVVVVTGASKGIGRAVALGLAGDGDRVVVSSRDQGRCQAVVDEIAAAGGEALAIAAHMGRSQDVEHLAAATLAAWGRIDVLINNAASNPLMSSLMDTPDALVPKMFATNVIGPLQLARLAADDMADRGEGVIVNVVSHAAFAPERNMGPYAATKSALVTLNKVMALEWAPLGIRVNAVAPGPFATVMVEELFDDPAYREQLLAGNAQHRIAAPDEIVGTVRFLCSPDAAFITGTVVHVDGGMVP